MYIVLNAEEYNILDSVLSKINPKTSFSIRGLYEENILKPRYTKNLAFDTGAFRTETERNVLNNAYSRITDWLIERGFAEIASQTAELQITAIRLTEYGVILWNYTHLSWYDRAIERSSTEQIISRIPRLIRRASPYGAFYIFNEPLSGWLLQGVDEKDLPPGMERHLLESNEKTRVMRWHEQYLQNEEALNYLVSEGFAVSRSDIKGNTFKKYRQLTDKGRELKECGSIEVYKAKIAALKEAEEVERKWREESSRRQHHLAIEQAELSKQQIILNKNQLFVNICIAVATGVAAIYYIVELVSNEYQIYLVGVLTITFVFFFGVIAGIIIYQLIKPQKR